MCMNVEVLNNFAMEKKELKVSKVKAGVVYLSRVPSYMNVKILRETLSKFGEIGRVFLQPNEKAPVTKQGRLFTEGWVEFKNKKNAKIAVQFLNNSMVGGRKSTPWHSELWNLKYLRRFHWTHLNERLAYEKAVHQQRLRTEIVQAKRESNFHARNYEKSQWLKKGKKQLKKKGTNDITMTGGHIKTYVPHLRETEEEIIEKKQKRLAAGGGKEKSHSFQQQTLSANKRLCSIIFSGGLCNEK